MKWETKPAQKTEEISIKEALSGTWFSGNSSGLLKLLEASLGNELNRKKLIDILEKRNENPVPLSEIIKISDSFYYLQEKLKGQLTEKDISWVNSMIKYFENWFYKGNWTEIPESQKENPNSYAYFSVPAGIINMFTKIKDLPEYTEKIAQFDRKKMNDFWNKIEDFEEQYVSKDRLKILQENENLKDNEKKTLENILKYRDTIRDLFKRSKKSVINEFKDYGPDNRKNSGSKAQDLYFLKTCLIAASKLRREKITEENSIFMPDLAIFEMPESNYEIYDMSAGKDRTGLSKMHYHPLRLPFCKFVVRYLENLKQ